MTPGFAWWTGGAWHLSFPGQREESLDANETVQCRKEVSQESQLLANPLICSWILSLFSNRFQQKL